MNWDCSEETETSDIAHVPEEPVNEGWSSLFSPCRVKGVLGPARVAAIDRVTRVNGAAAPTLGGGSVAATP